MSTLANCEDPDETTQWLLLKCIITCKILLVCIWYAQKKGYRKAYFIIDGLCWAIYLCCHLLTFHNQLKKIFFREYHQSAKQFGSRSGARSGPKLFTKVVRGKYLICNGHCSFNSEFESEAQVNLIRELHFTFNRLTHGTKRKIY